MVFSKADVKRKEKEMAQQELRVNCLKLKINCGLLINDLQ